MTERKYLPTFADLVDRLSIVLLKSVFIPENQQAYMEEIHLIENDLDFIGVSLSAKALRAVLVIGLTNRFIWENESKAREGGDEQDKLLKLTHSVNGVRSMAKNVLAQYYGERLDYKIDCFAESLPPELQNWKRVLE